MKVQGYRVGGRSERILEMKGQKRRGLPSDLAIPIGSPGEFHHPCCQVVELELKADKTSRPVPFYLTLLFICTLIDLFADDFFFLQNNTESLYVSTCARHSIWRCGLCSVNVQALKSWEESTREYKYLK